MGHPPTLRLDDSNWVRAGALCSAAHRPHQASQPAWPGGSCACKLLHYPAHLRRIRHAEAKVDRDIAENAQHAHASVLQLRLRAWLKRVRPGRRVQPQQPGGWRGGEPTSRAQRRGTVLERSSGSKPLSPGMVPSSAGAAFRKGIALDFSCQDRGWGCCVKPSGAGALLAQKTTR